MLSIIGILFLLSISFITVFCVLSIASMLIIDYYKAVDVELIN